MEYRHHIMAEGGADQVAYNLMCLYILGMNIDLNYDPELQCLRTR